MLSDGRPVAAVRICLGLATILNALEMYHLLGGIAAGKVALTVVDALPTPTPTAVTVYLVLALAAGAALTVGWHATSAAVVTTGLNVGVFLWDEQTYSSHRFLATLLVAYLIFARSDAAWSVSRRGGQVPAWPQLLMMTQLSACYLYAAVSKVSLVFLSGAPLAGWVWVSLPWWVFPIMALGTVVTELFLAVGLWWSRTRHVALTLGVLLHLSIVVLMSEQRPALVSFALTCVSLYALFVARGRRSRPSRESLTQGETGPGTVGSSMRAREPGWSG